MNVRLFVLLCFPLVAFAGPRISADYSIPAETTDSAGKQTSSVDYTNVASAGTVSGVSEASSPAMLVKAGYAGQLYEVSGFTVSSSSSSVLEKTQTQLTCSQLLDDATLLAISGSAVAWTVLEGPISAISSSGIATSGTVYETTPASVRGSYLGLVGTLNLSVLNNDNDDFGSYANDTLPDDWQVQYFGLDNPDAGPGADASHTGQTNYFKYIAGLDPTDPESVFTLSILPVPNQSSQKLLVFSPVSAGRSYTVESSTNISEWNLLTNMIQSDVGAQRIVTDLNPAEEGKFYRVLVSKP